MFCMPTDEAMEQKIITDAKLEQRLVFFNSFSVLMICLGIAIGLSIIYFILVECLAKHLMYGILITGMVMLFVVGVLLLFYGHMSPYKIVACIVLLLTFFACLASLFMLKGSLKLGALFLEESTRFASHSRVSLIYIFIFMLMTWLFLLMIIKEYTGFISVGKPAFSNESLYYKPSPNGLILTMSMLFVQLVWGLSFLKECFNFCVSNHTVNWYLKRDAGMCLVPNTFKLMFLHFGSIVGGSFINAVLFVPDMIADFVRMCLKLNNTDQHESDNCCTSLLDLVRSDAFAYIALAGNPFCNSTKYCEYLTNESMSSDGSQSSMRLYRICAHLCIVGTTSILGLYIKGQVEFYTIIATLILGIFVSTFIISYHSDAAEALLIMFLMEEEFYKRKDKKLKAATTLNQHDQKKYLEHLPKMYPEQHSEMAQKIKDLREEDFNKARTELEENSRREDPSRRDEEEKREE